MSFGDMANDSDWSISRIIAYNYNTTISIYILLPSFIVMIWSYAARHQAKLNALSGSIIATIAAPCVLVFEVVTYNQIHKLSVLGLSIGLVHFMKDMTWKQVLPTIIGLVVAWGSAFLRSCNDGYNSESYFLGAMVGVGEIARFLTWVTMI